MNTEENKERQKCRVLRNPNNFWFWYEYFKSGWQLIDARELIRINNIEQHKSLIDEAYQEYIDAYLHKNEIMNLEV